MINHLWIIMDWNRRWAHARLLPWIAWHKAWADNLEKITMYADELWIKYLTVWALSTDNLRKREESEVNWIIKLINNIDSYLKNMISKWLKFNLIWDITKLPDESQKVLNSVLERTKNNKWIVLTLALVYWWQDEIIRWIKKFIKKWGNVDELDKENFRDFLDTWDLPKPEIIVRTWWDIRHSWFMLYDSEYSEYYFTEKKWPDFDNEELDKVIWFYRNSKRNFWK